MNAMAKNTGRDERHGHALHRLGYVVELKPFSDARKDDQCEGEPHRSGHSIGKRLEQIVILLHEQYRYAEHGTVGRDERQEDAECLIKCRTYLLENYLDHLHKSRNHEDENNSLHVLYAKRHEYIVLQQIYHDGA